MDWARRLRKSNFIVRLTHWEHWPFGILQGPALLYWIWLAVRARSLFFFSASNPGILAGGMLGESKSGILEKLPDEVKPKTLLIRLPVDKQEILRILKANNLTLPVVFKPDIGERGWLVRHIVTEDDIDKYLQVIKIDFIVQELVSLPLEFAVFYYRFPGSESGAVNSITAKEFLSVTGDGKSTLETLIDDKPRARLHAESLNFRFRDELSRVLAPGEKKELVPIGNHCLGTKFINANHLISPRLSASFDTIGKHVEGFFFGRFDLRCATTEDLEAGRVIIVELNGCGAEPAHIYDPATSFWNAMGELFAHVRRMYDISVANHQRGVPYLSFSEGRSIYQKFRALKVN